MVVQVVLVVVAVVGPLHQVWGRVEDKREKAGMTHVTADSGKALPSACGGVFRNSA
jgi:hypothetical protein